MTKKHFIMFAKLAHSHRVHALAFKDPKDVADATSKAQGIEDAVVEIGKQLNPNFDENRFRTACQP